MILERIANGNLAPQIFNAALEVVSGFNTAPSTTLTALTYSNGSATIRYFTQGSAYLVTVWGSKQGAGSIQIRSPKFHDNVGGITMRCGLGLAGGSNYPLLPRNLNQPLFAQDTLTVLSSGSATAGDIENTNLLIYYDYLDNSFGNFISPQELAARYVDYVSLTHALVGGTTGTYGAAQALSGATIGTMKANTQYALCGYTLSQSAATTASTVGLIGVDTGNLLIGMPVLIDFDETNSWFIDLSTMLNKPAIPVINSPNWGSTNLSVLNDENANTVTVTTLWAELR